MITMTIELMIRSLCHRALARRAWRTVAVIGAAGGLLAAGCSSTTTTSTSPPPSPSKTETPSASPPTSTEAIPCQEITSLRLALTDLTTLKVTASSASRISKDIATIQTNLAALKGLAGTAFSTQISELESSMAQIKSAAATLSTNPTEATKELTAALNDLKAKAPPMIAQMKSVCPAG